MMRWFVLLIFLCYCINANAQILINEVCSKNENVIWDEFNDTPDWVELYNESPTAISLLGYYLSDDSKNIKKWQFPDVSIAPHSYLLVLASEQDTLSISIHTNFKVDSEGETLYLSKPNGDLVDIVAVPTLPEDHSYGRKSDGSSSFVFFETPTVNFSNNDNPFYEYATTPFFNNATSFLDEPTPITLSCEETNCKIYYTLDGSPPNLNSLLYTKAILIENTTSIRAISIADNYRPSSINSKTYFLNVPHNIPIVHISTAHEGLFSDSIGILRTGPDAENEWPYYGANYWKDIELPVHFEYLEADGNSFAQDVGLQVHGGRSSRTAPLKSIRLLAKDEYGKEVMEFPFFEDRTRTTYKRVVIRNTSGDFKQAYLRDAFFHDFLLKENVNVDAFASKAVALYYNGTYHGLLFLREKSDKYYLIHTYNMEESDFDLLEEDTILVSGSFQHFDAHYDFIRSNNLSDSSNFEIASTYFDLENLADYFIVETYINNWDWPNNNLKYWRNHKDEGKWRYLLFDIDVGMNGRGWTHASEDGFGRLFSDDFSANPHVSVLKSFLENDDYRYYFINRYADLINTIFQAEHFQHHLDNFIDPLLAEYQLHFEKWPTVGYEKWMNEKLPQLREFIHTRPNYARQYIQDKFDLEEQVRLELNVYPPEAGKIHLNTIQPEAYPWHGIYYKGIPVQLSIEANPGYTFQEWQSFHASIDNANQTDISVFLNRDDAITAYFEGPSPDPKGSIKLFPNPVDDYLQIQFVLAQKDQLHYRFYNQIGQLVGQSQSITLNSGTHERSVPLPVLDQGVYILEVQSNSWTYSQKIIKL